MLGSSVCGLSLPDAEELWRLRPLLVTAMSSWASLCPGLLERARGLVRPAEVRPAEVRPAGETSGSWPPPGVC